MALETKTELELRIEDLEKALASSNEDLATSDNKLREAQKNLAVVDSEAENLQEILDSAKCENNRLTEALANRLEEAMRLRAKVRELEADLSFVEDNLENERLENERLEEENKENSTFGNGKVEGLREALEVVLNNFNR